MKRLSQYITIAFLALGLAWLVWPAAAFAVADLSVNFQNTPLFSEASFAPGQTITRWADVTNNSASPKAIAAEAIHTTNEGGMASQMDLVISLNEVSLYSGTLKHFFDNGETNLSTLAAAGTNRYVFAVTFKPETNDSFQSKQVGFDLIIGFQGQETTPTPTPTPGGGGGGTSGGGGGLPPGLLITQEAERIVGDTFATITWFTNYFSTSQVVYSRADQPHTFTLTPPKYGYSDMSTEDSTMVTSHSVMITGLIPGTTYYFRVISHASPPTIGFEHTFKTSGTVAGATTPEITATPTPSGASVNTGAGAAQAAGATTAPAGQVAGVSRTESGQTGSTGATPGEEAGKVLGETVTQNEGAVKSGEKNLPACAPSPWWPAGYLVYVLLLAGAYLLALRGWKIAVWWLAPLIILVAGITWWWFEPCSLRLWYWPAMMVLIFVAASIWYIVAVSPEDPQPPKDQ